MHGVGTNNTTGQMQTQMQVDPHISQTDPSSSRSQSDPNRQQAEIQHLVSKVKLMTIPWLGLVWISRFLLELMAVFESVVPVLCTVLYSYRPSFETGWLVSSTFPDGDYLPMYMCVMIHHGAKRWSNWHDNKDFG